jgi:predicted NBD/HSP70 family sugar kinase
MTILIIDVGGTNIKLKLSDGDEVRKCPSGPTLTPQKMVDDVRLAIAGWTFDHITIGFPAPVLNGKIVQEPVNLGPGWVGFDFVALGKPFKLINDAAMQALGSYEGGRMLFLGLGTGLGNALIADGVIVPLEIGHLPYRKRQTYEQYVGEAGFKRLGKVKWQRHVFDVVAHFKKAFLVDYIVLGGGNVRKLDELPPGTRRGDNNNAFLGGARLWEDPNVQG